MNGTKEVEQRYTAEFKEKVIRRVREENLAYNEAEREYGIAHGSIQEWERIYLSEGVERLSVERCGRGRKGRPPKMPKKVEEDLLTEVQRLRAEKAYYSFRRIKTKLKGLLPAIHRQQALMAA